MFEYVNDNIAKYELDKAASEQMVKLKKIIVQLMKKLLAIVVLGL